MSPRYELVIFDMDGTLIDSADSIVEAAKEAIRRLDFPTISDSELRKCIGPPLAKTLVARGVLDEDDFDTFNETFRDIYKNEYLLDCNVYPGVMDVLRTLRGKVKLAVATNKRYDYAETLLKGKGLADYFDIIKGTDFENKLTKADLIEECVKELNVLPERTVMIGDAPTDLDSAKEASVDFVGVTYGFGFRKDEKIGRNIDRIEELLDIVL